MDTKVVRMIGPSDLYHPPPPDPRSAPDAVRYARDEFGESTPAWLLDLASRRSPECEDESRPRIRDSFIQFAKRAASFLL